MNANDGLPESPDGGDRIDPSLYLGGWDRSMLPANVVVGPACYIESVRVFERFRSERQPGMVLGRGVRVNTWTSFSVDPTGYVEIGDGSVLVGALLMCADRVVIGRDVVISYQVTIADSDFHPLDPALRREDAIANAPGGDRSRRPPVETRPVTIGDGALVGIGAMILKGVTIGSGARIMPGTVVTRDVPQGASVEGNPARPVTDR